MATINNSTADTLISGTSDADSISNYGDNVTIAVIGGNDTIYNYRANVSIDAGAGNDKIVNEGDTILGDSSDYVTINGGAGDDTVYNYYGHYVKIDAGAGNDSIKNTWSNYVTINTGDGNDTIYNESNKARIDAGAGNDSIFNYDHHKNTIVGGAGNDYIYNDGSSVSIDGGAGHDSLYNYYSTSVTTAGGTGNDRISLDSAYSSMNVIQYANGDGNDTVYGFKANDTLSISGGTYSSQISGSDVIVTVGEGSITLSGAASLSTVNISGKEVTPVNNITNTQNGVSVNGTSGADSITNSGSNVTITAQGNSDTVTNNDGDGSVIDLGAGDDSLYGNGNDSVTVDAGTGNDTINGHYYDSSINGGEGSDYINSGGGITNTVEGGDGNDTIISYGNSIDGGAGNDYISLTSSGSVHSVKGGTGNDSVYSNNYGGVIYQYADGDGNDYVSGFRAHDAFIISGDYSTAVSGNDIIITVGDGSITLAGAASLSAPNIGTEAEVKNLRGTEGNDTIRNVLDGATIQALGGNDSIYNYFSDSVSINAGDGNDTVYNYAGKSVTVDAGTGNDSINTGGRDNSISAGEGDDSIINGGGYGVTINAGAGNDRISLYSYSRNNVIQYKTGDGNDTVYGFDDDDTLKIDGNYSTLVSGSNVIVIDDEGSVVLVGAASLDHININVERIVNSDDDVSVSGTNDDDTIENRGSNVTINALGGNDSIENIGGSNVTILGGDGSDTVYNAAAVSNNGTWKEPDNVLIDAGDGDDSIQSEGTNATILGGAGNDRINLGQSSSVDGGTGDDYISNYGSNNTLDGGDGADTLINYGENSTLLGGAGNDSIVNYTGGSSISMDGGEGDDRFTNFGSDVTIAGGTGYDTIYNDHDASNVVVDGGADSDSIQNFGSNSTLLGGEGNDRIGNYAEGYRNGELVFDDGGRNVLIDLGAGNDSVYNYGGENVTINGGTGDDTVRNNGANVLITYAEGDGNDLIDGFNENSTLSIAGNYSTEEDGDDIIITVGESSITLLGAASLDNLNIIGKINNTVDSVLISGTDNPDTIENRGRYVTINALGGDDSIKNRNRYTNINAGAGNDTVDNDYDNVSIDAGTGDDYIYNDYHSVSIDAGTGNDSVYNYYGYDVTINGGAGNDSIKNENGSNVSIDAGAGNDFISNTDYSRNVTISGGKGNDTIVNSDKYNGVVYQYADGDGNDLIQGFKADDALIISGGTWSTAVSGSDVIVTVGTGKITLQGAASLSAIKIGTEAELKNLRGTTGADTLNNIIDGATIAALGGNDSIKNTAAQVSIDAGAGADTVYNSGNNAKISAGTGNDSIYNDGYNVSIDAGAGNDSIESWGDSVSIAGGAGNDRISLASYNWKNNVIQYKTGDGNDTVYGFDKYDTLKIDGDYSTQVRGNHVIVTVGDGSITLRGAASLDHLNINVDPIVNRDDGISIGGTDAPDTIENFGSNVSISALGGNDSIRNLSGSNVTVHGGGGNDRIEVSIIADRNGYQIPDNIFLNGGDGNDSISGSGTNVTIDGGTGDDSIYAINADKLTILGGAGNDTILNGGINVKIDGGAGNDSIENFSSNATLDSGEGDDSIGSWGDNVTLDAGAGNDLISLSTDYSICNVIQYESGDGNDSISGFNETDSLSILGNAYSTAVSDNDVIVTVDDGSITLTGAASLETVNIVFAKKNPLDVIGTDGADNIVNSLKGATVQALGGNDTVKNTAAQVSIVGGAGVDSINNSGTKVTILGDAGNDRITNSGSSTKINAGAGNDSVRNSAASVSIVGGAGKDSITNTKTGVTIDGGADNDRIVNSAATVSIAGGAGDDLVSIGANAKNNFITYTAGNDSIIGFNATSTLKIGDGSAEYSKDTVGGDVIIIVDDGKITLTGAASLTTFNILGTEKNPLNIFGTDGADKIINSLEGATINALGGNDSVRNSAANVSIVGGTGKDSITNTKTKVTIDAGADNDRIVNSAATVSIAGGAGDDLVSIGANAKNNFITYTAGNDSIIGYTEDDTISIASGAVSSVTVSGNDVIFTVGAGKISVKGGKGKTVTYFDDTGGHTYPLPSVVIDEETKTARLTEYFTDNAYSIADNLDVTTIDASVITYDIELVGNKKANLILSGKGNDTLIGSKGNDTLSGDGGSDVFLYNSGDGNDLITDYTEEDLIQIDGTVSKVTETTKGTVILYVGSNKISVKGGTEQLITYVDAAGVHTYPKVIETNDAGTAVTLTADYTADTFDVNTNPQVADYAAKLKTIDASAVTHDLAIIANKNANTIKGGDGNDTLSGGAGNDNLTGGKGSDVFLYTGGDGNDLITDYTEGEDKLRINGAISKIATTAAGTVIFTVDGGKVSVKSGANKVIAYEDSDAKQYFYPVTFNAAGTSAKLLANYTKDTFDVAKYGDYSGTVKTVNASAVTHDLTITGNKLANKIIGGSGNDTLIGGKGNDSLNGGKGSDVFVYNNGDGNDTIAGYTQGEDRIQIAAGKVDGISVSGSDVVFTVGKGKIIVKDGTEQLITYVDAQGKEHFYPDEVTFNAAGTAATILSSYSKSAFDITDYGSYGTSVQTINAAAVTHDISITANSKANTIYGSANNDCLDGGAAKDVLYGGEGNDTLIGGTGNDTLWGGDGSDVFLYNSGDGNDFIEDYTAGEKISVTGAKVDSASVSGSNVVLTIGAGKITVRDGKDKTVTYFDDDGKHTYGTSKDLLIDDNYSADAAQLTNIVEPVKASYTPYDFDAGLSLTRDEKLSPVFLVTKA